MTVDEVVGERVHQIMWRKRLQQIDVAPAAGMDQSGLSKRIRGKRAWSVEDIIRIAAALDVDPTELIADITPANGIEIGDTRRATRHGRAASYGYHRRTTRRHHPALTNRCTSNRPVTTLRDLSPTRPHRRCA